MSFLFSPQADTGIRTYLFLNVKSFFKKIWDGQGTSYTHGKDKMYDMGSISEAKESM